MFLIHFCWPADSSFIHSFLLFRFHHCTVSDSGIYGGGFHDFCCILPVGGPPEDSLVFQYSGYQGVGGYGVGFYGGKSMADVESFMIPASFLYITPCIDFFLFF